MTTSSLQTNSWVSRLKNPRQQSEALQELREILMRGLRRAFRSKGGGESFCEDVAQETLLRILDRLDQFSGRSRFTTWALSIGIRIGTSQFRRKRFRDVSLSAAGSEDHLQLQWADDDAVSAERRLDRQSLVDALREQVSTVLTDRQRQATEAIMHGMPVDVIAMRTDSNRNAVYKLIHDARQRLKQGLENAGYTADDVLMAFA